MPIPLTDEQVLQLVEHLNTIFGKTQTKEKSKTWIWKKRLILFDLPYWSDLDVRHCIDVMHVEKMFMTVSLGRSLTFKARQKMV